jgi:GT2 family glycosyltransferase
MRMPKGKVAHRSARRGLRTALARAGERSFFGFAVDPEDPTRRFTVEIMVDGHSIRAVRADAYVHELAQEGIGDACYGFSLSLPDMFIGDASSIEARLANLGTPVGAPIDLGGASGHSIDLDGSGLVRWSGGLRFSGWMSRDPPVANVFVDGVLVMRVHADGWSHVGSSESDARAVRAFDLHLPERFGDANPHRLEIINEAGERLRGSPLAFLAFADGLKAALARCGASGQEELRAAIFDRQLPMSLPFSQYQEWRSKFPIAPGPPSTLRGAVIMVGPGAMDDTLESLGDQTHADWIAACLPALSGPTEFRRQEAHAFLRGDGARCEFVVFGLAGTLFVPSALQRIAGVFSAFERAQAVYGDIEVQGADGLAWPLALPAFDYERMLEQGYCAHLFALRRPLAERLLATDAQDLYRLFNSIFDEPTASSRDVVHLPGAIGTLPAFDANAARAALEAAGRAHLGKCGVKALVASVSGAVLPAVRITKMFDRLGVTIVIPARNRRPSLQACIESIRPAVDKAQARILVVDNDSADPDMLAFLAEIEGGVVSVLRVPGEFNFPRLNNHAARAAKSDLLCLLDNDARALDEDWLGEMLGRTTADDVGAVGALMMWPSRVVRHGGIVLGPGFSAMHSFNDRIEGDPGYSDLLRVAHECSAVTAACLLTRRRDYLKVGGMDEVRFPFNFNEIDYCLKLRALGKRIVFTPHAKLVHHGAASRGSDLSPDRREHFERELQNLRAKWGSALAADPYYSPVLSLDSIPFSALAWPARTMEPRVNLPPCPADIPPGF